MTVSTLKTVTSSVGNAAEYTLIENTSKKQRIILDCICVILNCDATVASRYVRLKVVDQKANIVAAATGFAVTAGLSTLHNFSAACQGQFAGSNWNIYGLPKQYLEPFEKLTISISNGVAGDTVTVVSQGYTQKTEFST